MAAEAEAGDNDAEECTETKGRTKWRRVLPRPADAVEFVPGRLCGEEGTFAAVGTYQLAELERRRYGDIHLLRICARGGENEIDVEERDGVEGTTGIFDLKWRPKGEGGGDDFLLHAGADGSVRLHHMRMRDENATLSQVAMLSCRGDDGTAEEAAEACLSVDWEKVGTNGTASRAVASKSNGDCCLVSVRPDALTTTMTWHAQGMEAWAVHFDTSIDNICYSGGDDCVFRGWDLRTECDSPAFSNRKEHAAGVCCIASCPHGEYVVATGSYDEKLRLWDVRNLARPASTVHAELGGGVWRAKWHPTCPNLLLAACMHDGFKIINVQTAAVSTQVEYRGHSSLAYGADWAAVSEHLSIAGTCSFYDKEVHIWLVEH